MESEEGACAICLESKGGSHGCQTCAKSAWSVCARCERALGACPICRGAYTQKSSGGFNDTEYLFKLDFFDDVGGLDGDLGSDLHFRTALNLSSSHSRTTEQVEGGVGVIDVVGTVSSWLWLRLLCLFRLPEEGGNGDVGPAADRVVGHEIARRAHDGGASSEETEHPQQQESRETRAGGDSEMPSPVGTLRSTTPSSNVDAAPSLAPLPAQPLLADIPVIIDAQAAGSGGDGEGGGALMWSSDHAFVWVCRATAVACAAWAVAVWIHETTGFLRSSSSNGSILSSSNPRDSRGPVAVMCVDMETGLEEPCAVFTQAGDDGPDPSTPPQSSLFAAMVFALGGEVALEYVQLLASPRVNEFLWSAVAAMSVLLVVMVAGISRTAFLRRKERRRRCQGAHGSQPPRVPSHAVPCPR